MPQELGDLQDPARWSGIEREAHLIGRRIRHWVASEDAGVTGQPLRYRDVVVLLRAAKVNAERIASVLSAMGIPAHAGVGGSLFGTLEVRDVLAVLRVLDNPRQDIPLTAVLRNGVLGESLSEDDLVAIRCLDRTIPFHEAVDRYAQCGQDSAVQDSAVQDSEVQDSEVQGSAVQQRLRVILDRIERYRIEIRHKPLADVLWSLYDRQGTLAYAGGLRNGPQRCANLYKLHELARKFGTFRRQGLHRFLRFIETLEEEGEELAVAPTIVTPMILSSALFLMTRTSPMPSLWATLRPLERKFAMPTQVSIPISAHFLSLAPTEATSGKVYTARGTRLYSPIFSSSPHALAAAISASINAPCARYVVPTQSPMAYTPAAFVSIFSLTAIAAPFISSPSASAVSLSHTARLPTATSTFSVSSTVSLSSDTLALASATSIAVTFWLTIDWMPSFFNSFAISLPTHSSSLGSRLSSASTIVTLQPTVA